MKKLCPKCKRNLDEKDYNWRYKGKLRATYCKECSRKEIKKHYYSNKDYYLNKAKKRNRKLKQEIVKYLGNYLSNHCCVDCNESNIIVLEFDHRDSSTKSYDLNTMIKNGKSLKQIEIEVAKCDIRCANCHRKKTAKENNSWKIDFKRL